MAGAVNIRLGAIVTDLLNGFSRAGQAARGLASTINGNLAASFAASDRQSRQFNVGLGRLANNLQSFGRQASIASAAIIGIGAMSYKAYGDIDGLQRALTITAGSTEAANKQFVQFRQLAKLPGLGLEEVVQSGVQLETLGYKAQTAQKYISEIGNAIALGGKGKFEYDQVITQFTQMSGKAKVLGDDLKPIVNASPVIAKAIQDMFGTTASEEISKKLQAAGKGPKDFIDDLVTSLSTLKRVEGGPKNAIENFGDAVKISGFEFAKAADQALGLTEKLDGLGNFLTAAATGFGQLSPTTKAATLGVVGFVAVIGPMVLGLGGAINLVRALTLETGALTVGVKALQTAFLFLTGPIGATVLAATAVIGALGVLGYSIQHYGEKLKTTADKAALLADVQGKVSEATAEETTKLNTLLAIAKDETISRNARLKAVADLNAISPEYLGNLRLETINTADATKQIGLYTNALVLKAKVAALQGKAAQASIKVDEIGAKSANDFVDKSRFSADQIAINVKTSFSFDREADGARLFKQKGEERKKAALAVAADEAKFYSDQLKKAYDDAAKSNIQLEAPKVVTPTYLNVGNQSELQKAKEELKKLKTEIFADQQKGLDVTAKLARKTELESAIKAATGSLKEQKTKLEEAQAQLSKLGGQIQNYEFKGITPPAELLQKYVDLKERVEKAQAALQNFKALDLGELKPLASTASSKRVGDIIDQVGAQQTGPKLPGLAQLQDRIKVTFAEINRDTQAAVDSLNFQLSDRFSQAFSGNSVGLGELAQILGNAKVDLANQVNAFSSYLGIAKDQLAASGVGLLESFGTAIGSGGNPLQSILKTITNFIGDFAIKLGSAILLMGKLETVAAAIPGLAPLFALTGPAKIIAGAGLVAGGAAIKAFAMESGGLVTGSTFANLGETSKARAGGGEYVASVELGSNLIGDRIMKKIGGMQFNRPDMSRVGRQSLDLNVSGRFDLRNGDLSASIDDYQSQNSYFN